MAFLMDRIHQILMWLLMVTRVMPVCLLDSWMQICEAFGANRYPFPEEPARQRQMNAEVTARLRELHTTIEAGDTSAPLFYITPTWLLLQIVQSRKQPGNLQEFEFLHSIRVSMTLCACS